MIGGLCFSSPLVICGYMIDFIGMGGNWIRNRVN